MATSGRAASNIRPSSSIPARVFAATSSSLGEHASAMAIPPCGAMAPKTSGTSAKGNHVCRGRWREAPDGEARRAITSPLCGEGGAKRRMGRHGEHSPSPLCGEGGAKRRMGGTESTRLPRYAGKVARSAGWGGTESNHFPAMRGRWREAPDGEARRALAFPAMRGRWREAPDGEAQPPHPILSTPMEEVSPLRLTEYSHGAG